MDIVNRGTAAVCNSLGAADCPSSGRAARAPATGSKRSAAAAQLAELSEKEEEEKVVLSNDEEQLVVAMPKRRGSSRAAAAGILAALEAEHVNDAEMDEELLSRVLPRHAAATRSPAGK